MKQPKQKHDELLRDIQSAPNNSDHFTVWWMGQSGFLVKYNGKHLLFDPYLSESLTVKYSNTEKPHLRMTELVVDPIQLDFIDVTTSTHNHTDHLDADTLKPLREANPNLKLVLPSANIEFAQNRLGGDDNWFVGMNDGDEETVAGFIFHAVPAAHEVLDQDEMGQHRFLGYIVKFGSWTIYHSGDTVRYDGMAERLKPYNIDLAFLPINGSKPERNVSGNMWGHEAVQLAKDAGIGYVIPCHFDMFAFNTVTPEEFISESEIKELQYSVLQNGESLHSRFLRK